jgi:hypothetical protein
VRGIELVAYEPGDKEAYIGLLEEAWGPRALTKPEFEWWFERNPAGSLMSVARSDGRVVGVAAHSLYRMVLEGEERTASFSVHATTEASVRGRGVFTDLELKHEREAQERGVAVVLAFASAPTAPLFLGPLGWTEIARYRMWARPLVRRREEGRTREPLDVKGDAAAGWPNHIVRDSTYLAWRYLDSPRGYESLGSANGYVVLGRRSGTALVADLAAPRSEQRGLLRRAIGRAGRRLLIAVPAPEQRATFLSLGFVPTHKSLHFMGKALAGRLNTDPRAWRFTLGDTDFF